MMNDQVLCRQVVEALRCGIPPRHGVQLYSVGNDQLIDGIKRYHLSAIADQGIIRFISGSWGSGKTHIFRQLREVAFSENCLVSSVELNVNEAALDKFESVFHAIIRNLVTPLASKQAAESEAAPFRHVIREALAFLASGDHCLSEPVPYEHVDAARQVLMVDSGIDIDFKKMVVAYWETFLPEAAAADIQEATRAEILQWFSGEGTIMTYRKRFGVTKFPNKDNAKIMLQSLAAFVRLCGYRGLLIQFDEAEQAYSIMRSSKLKNAHNNLLSLINNIGAIPGLFLIYATTLDFFTDPKHGIVIYGALAGRVGKPTDSEPRALSPIWNLDAVRTELADYQAAARKIMGAYACAYGVDLPPKNRTGRSERIVVV